MSNMNVQRVRDLANKIEALPDHKVDMSTFMDGMPDSVSFSYEVAGRYEMLVKACGTHGCIAGWAVAFYGDPTLMSRTSIEAEAARLLELREDEAYNLFFGRWAVGHDTCLDKISKEQVVAYLRHCAELGYIPNPNFCLTDEMLQP